MSATPRCCPDPALPRLPLARDVRLTAPPSPPRRSRSSSAYDTDCRRDRDERRRPLLVAVSSLQAIDARSTKTRFEGTDRPTDATTTYLFRNTSVKMKVQVLAICVLSILCQYVSGEHCYDDVIGVCSPTGGSLTNCNSKYGAFVGDELLTSVQHFARSHIQRSFQFLLMSSYFGNYEKNRHGFEKLYKKFSDDTWEKAIDLVKYLGKRGGHMTFRLTKEENEKQMIYELFELGSMGKALDMHKGLAKEANYLHSEVTRKKEHDPEVASYLENNFVHQHSDVIRTLSGHTNDLKHLIANEADSSLALYLFDEYLQKSI